MPEPIVVPVTALTAVTVVIDGANVVGSRPDGWWRDRAGAAARLAAQLQTLADAEPGYHLVLVLEGAARAGVPSTGSIPPADTMRGLEVVHAPAAGDEEIVRQSRRADRVITADRELRRRVAPVPCEGPGWVWDRLLPALGPPPGG